MRHTLTGLWHTDPRLTAMGLLMIAMLGATAVGLAIDPRVIGGAPAWLKPAKFAASVAIFCLTLAWVFTYIPAWRRTRTIVSWVTTVMLSIEIVIIDVQAFRGTTSHFNVATPVDGALFTIMALAIVVQTLSTIALAVALWRQSFVDRAMGWALRFGVTLTIIGAMSGGFMTRPTAAQLESARSGTRVTIAGAHTVGAPDGGPGLPGTAWSIEHGDLRVAHFLGLHAMQLIPLIAVAVVGRGWRETRRVRLVTAISASYGTLFVLLLWQALRGQSVIAPDGTMLAALAAWAVLTAVGIATAVGRPEPMGAGAVVY